MTTTTSKEKKIERKIEKNEIFTINIDPVSDLLSYFPDFFSKSQADFILERIHKEVEYLPRTHEALQFIAPNGQTLNLPRDKGIYGDIEKNGEFPLYRYGDKYPEIKSWTPVLLELRNLIHKETGQYCNHLVVNKYQSGLDHIGFHHDKPRDMAIYKSVQVLNFGSTRVLDLQLNNKKIKAKEHSYPHKIRRELAHGSLYQLPWETNKIYKHRIKPEKSQSKINCGERISLTYRSIHTIMNPTTKRERKISF